MFLREAWAGFNLDWIPAWSFLYRFDSSLYKSKHIYLTSLSFLDTVEPTVEKAADVFSDAVLTADDVFWYLQNKPYISI